MKKTVIVIVIVLMIIGICIFAFIGNKENKIDINNNAISNNKENIEQNQQGNQTTQNIVENITENEIIGNIVENTVSSETFEESPKSSEEKAIIIVKNDWGNSSSVKISVDGINENGKYIVAVRDINTTEALAFYTVDISTETFNKREMN